MCDCAFKHQNEEKKNWHKNQCQKELQISFGANEKKNCTKIVGKNGVRNWHNLNRKKKLWKNEQKKTITVCFISMTNMADWYLISIRFSINTHDKDMLLSPLK